MSVEFTETQAEEVRKRTLLDALYRRYSSALRKFLVRRHVNRDDVADIVQETYCRVIKSGDVETIQHPKAFLFQVANNVVRNAAKHRRSGVEDDAVDIDGVEVNDEGTQSLSAAQGRAGVGHRASGARGIGAQVP